MIIEESFHNIEDFQRVAHSTKGKYFLYFYAPWCNPCEDQLKAFKQIEKDFPKIPIFSLNAEKHMFLINCFQIKGLPYSLLMENITVLKTFQGVVDFDYLKTFIEKD